MISKIDENPHLSSETKKVAERKLQKDLQNLLLLNAMRSLESGCFNEAASIAALFNQVSTQNWKKLLLSIIVEVSKVFPLFQRVLVWLLAFRRFCRRRLKSRCLQGELLDG